MNEKNTIKCFLLLSENVDVLLRKNNFVLEKKNEWVRRTKWKKDIVKIRRENDADWVWIHFLVTFEKFKGKKYQENIFSQRNVGHLIGIPLQKFYFPKFFIFSSRFVFDTVNKIEKALNWFDRFSTPENCISILENIAERELKNLERNEIDVASSYKSPAYLKNRRHLEKATKLEKK